jgi:hypothetical protein
MDFVRYMFPSSGVQYILKSTILRGCDCVVVYRIEHEIMFYVLGKKIQ